LNIETSNEGIKKMLFLIWGKSEKLVKEMVVGAYWELYMDEKEFTKD